MKKLFLLPAVFVVLTVGLSSCAKCEICTKDSEPELRICEPDYSSNTEYGYALDYYEANGFVCKTSL